MKTNLLALNTKRNKNLTFLTITIFIVATVASCKKECFPINAKGSNVSKNYEVPSFSAVELSINAAVFVIQDSLQTLKVEAPENIQKRLSLTVSNGILNIGYKSHCGAISNGNTKIYITAPQINGLTISGSGNISCSNSLTTSTLNLKISGSGGINATTIAESVIATISGSGNMNLTGTTNFQDLKVSGSGDFKAFNLNSAHTTIKISGSGNAEVTVTNSLNVDISGSGDVYYKGNPTINTSISGSGKLKHVD